MAPSLGYRDAVHSLRELGLEPSVPVLAVGAPEWLDEVRGDIASLAGALLASCAAVVAPAFTFRTMVTPPFGPEGNGMTYRGTTEANAEADVLPCRHAGACLARPAARGAAPHSGRPPFRPPRPFVCRRRRRRAAGQAVADRTVGPARRTRDTRWRGGAAGRGPYGQCGAASGSPARRAQAVRALGAHPEGVVECPGFPGCSRGSRPSADACVVSRARPGSVRPDCRPSRCATCCTPRPRGCARTPPHCCVTIRRARCATPCVPPWPSCARSCRPSPHRTLDPREVRCGI